MPGACCNFMFYCIHFCLYIPTFLFVHSNFILQMLLAVCRWYAAFLSFCVSSSSVLWAAFWFCWMTFILTLFSVCGDSNNPVSPKIVFMVLCSWYSWRWKCGAVWGPCLIELTASDYCDLILIWTKKPSNTHALSTSCPQINVTHSGMNLMVATVCYMEQHVGWCDWLVTQKSRYWYHKIGNISCLNSHFLSQFMLKWSLYHHMSFCIVCYWCLLITAIFENLCTTWHRTTMLQCWDW